MTKNAASNASSWIAAVSIRYECRCASTINADTTVSFDVVLNSVREFWYSMYDNMRFPESNISSSGGLKTAFCWAKMSLSGYEIYGQAKRFEHGFRARKYRPFLVYYMNKMHLPLNFCFVQDRSSKWFYLERHKGLIHGDQVGPSFEVKSIPFVDRYSGLVNNWVW